MASKLPCFPEHSYWFLCVKSSCLCMPGHMPSCGYVPLCVCKSACKCTHSYIRLLHQLRRFKKHSYIHIFMCMYRFCEAQNRHHYHESDITSYSLACVSCSRTFCVIVVTVVYVAWFLNSSNRIVNGNTTWVIHAEWTNYTSDSWRTDTLYESFMPQRRFWIVTRIRTELHRSMCENPKSNVAK